MVLIGKGELPEVAYQGMNEVHGREIELLNRLYRGLKEGLSFEELDELFNAFLKDVEEHFSYEEDLMRKSFFFAYDCHFGEHKRVREELSNLKEKWERGKDPQVLIDYFEKTFKPWIFEHVTTMDTVTAEWVSRVLGGVAV